METVNADPTSKDTSVDNDGLDGEDGCDDGMASCIFRINLCFPTG